ncbi:diacylglycerol kinase family protein [Halobacillus sp. Marseille-P3879]|uniref:diacylglycerol/lipid kinase family protein n=1 Tax=Halobacillus sp. Marseille-P3879 TaxID=2045014 RepID=UPI000C7C8187|nr:diacylglycerol kinase family protein [Halobacillus sp. Marseille-P3879]
MYIVITNPKAGDGSAFRLLELIQKEPLFRSNNCRSYQTEYNGHANTLVKSIVKTYYSAIKAVIIIGGDGTIHEVINGLAPWPELPVGIIPAGTGNDFARGLELKSQGITLFRKIMSQPNIVKFKIGQVDILAGQRSATLYFINSAGTGLDSQVAATANESVFRRKLQKSRLGRLQYLFAFLKGMKRFKYVQAEVDIEGRRVKSKTFTLAVIANHPFFGKGMKIAPKSHLTSPKFSIILIEPITRWKLIFLFATVFAGKHISLKKVHEVRGSSIKLKGTESLLLQLDGQIYRCDECRIKKTKESRLFLTD